MEEETKTKVEATVLDILRESFTESKVRAAAADRLGIDLSAPDLKLFVRGVFQRYLRSLPFQEEEEKDGAGVEGKGKPDEKQDEEEKGKDGGGGKRERDDAGDLVLCRVSSLSPSAPRNPRSGPSLFVRSIPFQSGC